jgi:hypothetical protein
MDNSFIALLQLLAPHYNPDHWADDVQLDVAALLDHLPPGDWQRLADEARRAPSGWCVHLADAARATSNAQASDLLIELLRRTEPEVGAAAAAALLELDYQWSPEVSLRADLQRHLATASEMQAAAIRRLLGRLPS